MLNERILLNVVLNLLSMLSGAQRVVSLILELVVGKLLLVKQVLHILIPCLNLLLTHIQPSSLNSLAAKTKASLWMDLDGLDIHSKRR